MKKLNLAVLMMVVVLILGLASMSFSDSLTTYYGLTKPSRGSSNWDTKINADFDIIDTQLYANHSEITTMTNLTTYYILPNASITDHSNSAVDGSFANVIGDIGSSEAGITAVGPYSYAITSDNVTVPYNVAYLPQRGAMLSTASGKSITFDSPDQIQAGRYQIFTGSGSVHFTNPGVVIPEWWGIDDDNRSASSSTSIRSAMVALPNGLGGKISFGCKIYSFNLTVDRPNIWLDGCGASSNTYWTSSQWQAYDVTTPIVKVTSVVYGAGVKAGTGFQLTNVHLNGINSDGVKFGQKGILIRSNEYYNIANVNVEYFTTYQLQFGDSDMIALGESGTNSEWVYFGNIVNSTFKAHQTYTTGDTIKQIYDGDGVTSQHISNCNIYGPGASGGYALYDVTNQKITNSYIQIPADGHGLYKSSSAGGKYILTGVTAEGPYSGDYYTDTACTVNSYHTNGNSVFSVLEAANLNATGNYCDGNGQKWLLYEMESVQQTAALYSPSVVSSLNFIYGGTEPFANQTASGRRVYAKRSAPADYGVDVAEIYGTNGTVIHASSSESHKPALRVYNRAPRYTESSPVGLSVIGQTLAATFRAVLDDNGTTYPIYPALRIYRLAHDRAGDGLYDPTLDGFGTAIDFYLGTDAVGGEDAAGRLAVSWVDSDDTKPTSTVDLTLKGLTRAGTSATVGGLNLLNGSTTFSSKGKDTHDLVMKLDDDSNSTLEQGRIRTEMTDNSTGAENSVMGFWTKASGTLAERVRVTTRGIAVDGYTPANAQADCTTGEIAWDNSTIYVCVDGGATVKWRKTSMLSW